MRKFGGCWEVGRRPCLDSTGAISLSISPLIKTPMSFLKILVIGEVATGKTSLANRIVSNNFSENYRPTIGCEFGFKVLELKEETVRVQLWDLAGQDRLGGMSRLYCRDAHGVIVVCDITHAETIEKTVKWKGQVEEYVTGPDKTPIPMVLCVNKIDVAGEGAMTEEKLAEFVRENKFAAGFFTSAKSGLNADLALSTHATKILEKQATTPQLIDPRSTGAGQTLKLVRQSAEQTNPKTKKQGCC